MNKHNKHHHRKVNSDKEEKGKYGSKSPGSKENSVRSSQERSDKDAREIEEGSRLHLADATLQTPEEDARDKKSDQSATDKVEATRI